MGIYECLNLYKAANTDIMLLVKDKSAITQGNSKAEWLTLQTESLSVPTKHILDSCDVGSTNDVGMNPCWKSNLQWNKQRAVSIQTNREGGRVKFSTKWRPALITMPLYMTTGRLYKLLSMRSESKYLYNFNLSYFALKYKIVRLVPLINRLNC